MESFIAKYSNKISAVVHCYNRVIIAGTLPELSNFRGIKSYIYGNNIRIFDYPKFAEQFRDKLRANAEKFAKENGIELEFMVKSITRKEEIISKKKDQV